MLVHRKNMIRVTVGWTNQFIMNNPKIQMSSAQTEFCRAGGDPSKGGVLSPELPPPHPQKKTPKGQSSLGASSKAANWRSLGLHRPVDLHWSCRDLYLQGLVGETYQDFLNDFSSFPFASPHPSPYQEFLICCFIVFFFFFWFWAACSYCFHFNFSLGS